MGASEADGSALTAGGTKWFAAAAAFVLLAQALVLAWLASASAWVVDEPNYLYAGLALRQELKFDAYNTVLHGPLTFYANQLFYPADLTADQLEHHKLAARLGAIPFTLLATFATGLLARAMFGAAAGLVAMLLFAVNPVTLAHGCLITADMPLTAGYALVAWLTWRWLRAPSGLGLVALGAALGATLATKYLALFLLPSLGLIAGIATATGVRPRLLWTRRETHGGVLGRWLELVPAAAVVGGAALLLLHACYGFRPGGYVVKPVASAAAEAPVDPRDPEAGPLSASFRGALELPGVAAAVGWLPEPFVRGIDYQKLFSEQGGRSYFRGAFGPGFGAYMVSALMLKLPLPLIILLALSLLSRAPPWPRHALLLLGGLAAVPLLYLSFGTSLQIGVRYILPVVPLAAIVAARGAVSLWRRPGGTALLAGLGAWVVLSTAVAWPNYVGWFNGLAKGQPYRWFNDSNVDWRHRGWSPDPAEAALARRHPGSERLSASSGPRLGTVRVHAFALCAADPRDPARAYHWLRGFAPVDRADAWFAFEVDEVAFREVAQREPRARVELAIALLGADRIPAALQALAGSEDPDSERVRAAASVLGGGAVPASQAATAWAGLGRHDRVLALGAAVPALPRAAAHVQREELDRAVAVLTTAEQQRALSAPEALLLASALELDLRPADAIACLERYAPEPEDPTRPAFDAVLWRLRQALITQEAVGRRALAGR
ncbi:MAG: glycosyltransferase family 39 protein [Planctomycetota bacterium]